MYKYSREMHYQTIKAKLSETQI